MPGTSLGNGTTGESSAWIEAVRNSEGMNLRRAGAEPGENGTKRPGRRKPRTRTEVWRTRRGRPTARAWSRVAVCRAGQRGGAEREEKAHEARSESLRRTAGKPQGAVRSPEALASYILIYSGLDREPHLPTSGHTRTPNLVHPALSPGTDGILHAPI